MIPIIPIIPIARSGCDIECHQKLLTVVAASLHAHGKELMISVDDSFATPSTKPLPTNWSYETEWKYFLPYADLLINMGTYPGPWAQGTADPPPHHTHTHTHNRARASPCP
jgi:hypothetical protein